MKKITLTKDLEATLQRAADEARARRHEHVTLEHLLLALGDDPDAGRLFKACRIDLPQLTAALDGALAEQDVLAERKEPEHTRAFWRVVERAAMQAQSSG